MSELVNNQKLAAASHPPGPQGHWLWGTAPEFRRDLLGTLTGWVDRYGDAVYFRFLGPYRAYIFCHPQHNRRILEQNHSNYTKLPNPVNDFLVPIVGHSVLTSDGEAWQKLRGMSEPALDRDHVATFGVTMTESTGARMEQWRAHVESGTPLDIAEEMTSLTLEIAGKTLLSVDLTGEGQTVGKTFITITRQFFEFTYHPLGRLLIKLDWLPGTRRFKRNIARLDDVIYQVIAERRALRAEGHAPNGDLLDLLMDARDEETGEGLSDRQLRNETLTLLLGGQQPTANLLAWTLYLLSQHPQVRERVEQEVDDVLGGRVPAIEDISGLTYMRMVLEESMRLYPPTYAIIRTAQEDDVVGGYRVDAGANVTLSPYLTHRHPQFWDDPDTFDPQRFSPEQKAERPRYAYIPFSAGPRHCIGKHFSTAETMLVLAMIAQRYRLHLVPGHPVEPEPLITLRPRHGLRMTVEAR